MVENMVREGLEKEGTVDAFPVFSQQDNGISSSFTRGTVESIGGGLVGCRLWGRTEFDMTEAI